ncbi:MAG: aminoglycoside phosphotransferase family protein [Rhodospirillaceae bacterium]
MSGAAQSGCTIRIDTELVRDLIAAQFPKWKGLAVTPVEPGGWDNRTFRLGADMAVRLPSAEVYAAQVKKEQAWLPRLAPHLPLAIPRPLAMGEPSGDYPWRWSVYEWLSGESADTAHINDPAPFAKTLAGFLSALRAIDTTGGPEPGAHNFFRGAHPHVYDAETKQALGILGGEIDTKAASRIWNDALSSTWQDAPVWLHGDVSAGNLLVEDGELRAVIDFGGLAIGDPACDLAIAWTFFDEDSRDVFRAHLELDDDTWARGRGWALWKALVTLAGLSGNTPAGMATARRAMDALLNEPGSGA